ncbi:MAG: hypothetical protein A3A24_01465 [Candidatus Buchananbacteria bacterium RIFCSPLOWO2_01_FULL_46_12]|uniref:DDH domain-containing protein n=2 Tax=Candidatus Buchananiibacteriota TaxID=1817903 RepID=A0A1G1YSZ0_9BACT|nr:MAG: hypothetical protein A2744_04500 [Candidatus Buchananbacteria bacterium RIFCSPHIGHO2_01_FULL_44_11]OGY55478.1 MAG: hypothetical protein A3A24_01465 [Candidatus Buchananbacteria bacterium RIFCSPLOWO2_01_FULL_46_12]
MALNEVQQIEKEINQSRHALITFDKDYSVDAVASALALYLILQKKGKLVDIVCDGFDLPKNLRFLPQAEKISPRLANLQKLIIKIAGGKENIDQFNYNIEGDGLKIYLTPKDGTINVEDIKTESSEYKYDLIFVLDTADLDSLGTIYQKSTEFFYNTTIINIDHKSENEQFGQINLTDPNAVATAEMVFELINGLGENLLDQPIATCLLTGLVAKTRSFKTANVRPKTLEAASQLLILEADQQTIVKNLYRSRTLATLNLWGRTLARLKSDDSNKLIWSLLTDHDFLDSQADQKDLPDVVEELISFIPGVEVVILIYQLNGQVKVLINALKNHNALYLAKTFRPEGTKNVATFSLTGTTLLAAEKTVIEEIKYNIGKK